MCESFICVLRKVFNTATVCIFICLFKSHGRHTSSVVAPVYIDTGAKYICIIVKAVCVRERERVCIYVCV